MILIFAAHPLYRILQRWVDKVFYGGWYDDRAVVKQVSRALTQAEGDVYGIAMTLCQALQKTLQIEYVNLVLSDGRVVSTEPLAQISCDIKPFHEESKAMQFFDKLRTSVGREIGTGTELVELLQLSGLEKSRILGRRPYFWLLLGGKNSYRGLLVLGFRRGGGEFAPRDLEILEVVIRQAGAALENEFLLEEVRQRSDQIKDLHRQAHKAREEERKRVARDLHDKIVQALVGINYHLSNMRIRANQEIVQELSDLQAELRLVLGDLRQVCVDLRPPALDVVGLIPTIQSRIAELQAQVPFDIELHVDKLNRPEIPEDVALCVYRFFQEAILNVQKHADANSVTVCFCLGPDGRLTLSIKDDGRGFEPPTNLGVLAQRRHFGLVGLQEQVEAVGGELIIQSAPGRGCCITAQIPIDEKNAY